MINKTKAQLIELLKVQHKNVKCFKKIFKRDARLRKELFKIAFNSRERTSKVIDEKNKHINSLDITSKMTEQHLKSCEAALIESNQVNRYLESRVQELTIMLHEAERVME